MFGTTKCLLVLVTVQIISTADKYTFVQAADASSCTISKTIVNKNQNVCEGALIFEDTFDDSILNTTKWNWDVRIPFDNEDDDFVSFQRSDKILYIKDNKLYIRPELLTEYAGFDDVTIQTGSLDLGNSCTGNIDRFKQCQRKAGMYRILPPIVSSRITTKNSFSFKYGAVEIRAKMPKGDWLFPQLFLEPLTNHYGLNQFASGQIRIGFTRGNTLLYEHQNTSEIGGNKAYGGVVLAQGETHRNKWMKGVPFKGTHFGDSFNIFRVNWTEEYISFSLNDFEYYKITENFAKTASKVKDIEHSKFWQSGDRMAPFDKEFYLSLGVSAGGISDFPDHSTSTYNAKKPWINLEVKNELNFWKKRNTWHDTWGDETSALKVDYIRVWAL